MKKETKKQMKKMKYEKPKLVKIETIEGGVDCLAGATATSGTCGNGTTALTCSVGTTVG